jgi:hypothetical protein
MKTLQYVSNGSVQVGVIVPLEIWRKIKLEKQVTAEKHLNIDALAEMAKLAQPLGPSDLASNFEYHTSQRVINEPAQ